MFTGIVHSAATVQSIVVRPGLRSIALSFAPGFSTGLVIGASVAVDGVCLTVTAVTEPDSAAFDVMHQSLSLTTLQALRPGGRVNVERAAPLGAEVGGHPLSGHIDFTASIASIQRPENNCVLRIAVPAPWMRYLFAKGYVAINGASLTIASAYRGQDGAGWVDVWLIPETMRITTFAQKKESDLVNVEVDRQTQIIVDTLRDAVDGRFEALVRDLDAASMSRAPPNSAGHARMAKKKLKKHNDPIGPHNDPIGPHNDPIGPHGDPIGPHKKKKKKKAAKKMPKKKK